MWRIYFQPCPVVFTFSNVKRTRLATGLNIGDEFRISTESNLQQIPGRVLFYSAVNRMCECWIVYATWDLDSAAGTAHGLVLFNYHTQNPVLHKCMLNPNGKYRSLSM